MIINKKLTIVFMRETFADIKKNCFEFSLILLRFSDLIVIFACTPTIKGDNMCKNSHTV
jgi:CDP-diglyceride synthetase